MLDIGLGAFDVECATAPLQLTAPSSQLAAHRPRGLRALYYIPAGQLRCINNCWNAKFTPQYGAVQHVDKINKIVTVKTLHKKRKDTYQVSNETTRWHTAGVIEINHHVMKNNDIKLGAPICTKAHITCTTMPMATQPPVKNLTRGEQSEESKRWIADKTRALLI